MTHIFQPLDLTVNGAAKVYKKKQITEWHNIGIVQERYVESISIHWRCLHLSPSKENGPSIFSIISHRKKEGE